MFSTRIALTSDTHASVVLSYKQQPQKKKTLKHTNNNKEIKNLFILNYKPVYFLLPTKYFILQTQKCSYREMILTTPLNENLRLLQLTENGNRKESKYLSIWEQIFIYKIKIFYIAYLHFSAKKVVCCIIKWGDSYVEIIPLSVNYILII